MELEGIEVLKVDLKAVGLRLFLQPTA